MEIEQISYKPFGEVKDRLYCTGSTDADARLKYIGKQMDFEMGLADHGVRKYDNALGMFTSIDPLWEKYYGWTPYQYCGNNPMMSVDPSGKDDYGINTYGEITWMAESETTNLLSYAEDEQLDRSNGITLSGEHIIQNYKYIVGSGRKGWVTETGNKEDAEKFYEFCAANTSVEWGVINKNEEYLISNGGRDDKAQAHSMLLLEIIQSGQGDLIKFEAHSHPIELDTRKVPQPCRPSGLKGEPHGDVTLRALNDKYINPNSSFIYCPQDKTYTNYKSDGSYEKNVKSPFK
jgi:RHS repeat-associated protein